MVTEVWQPRGSGFWMLHHLVFHSCCVTRGLVLLGTWRLESVKGSRGEKGSLRGSLQHVLSSGMSHRVTFKERFPKTEKYSSRYPRRPRRESDPRRFRSCGCGRIHLG